MVSLCSISNAEYVNIQLRIIIPGVPGPGYTTPPPWMPGVPPPVEIKIVNYTAYPKEINITTTVRTHVTLNVYIHNENNSQAFMPVFSFVCNSGFCLRGWCRMVNVDFVPAGVTKNYTISCYIPDYAPVNNIYSMDILLMDNVTYNQTNIRVNVAVVEPKLLEPLVSFYDGIRLEEKINETAGWTATMLGVLNPMNYEVINSTITAIGEFMNYRIVCLSPVCLNQDYVWFVNVIEKPVDIWIFCDAFLVWHLIAVIVLAFYFVYGKYLTKK